jgi:ParB-like chromosome segregation protein Spo0J
MNPLPALTGPETAALTDSIRRDGVQYPILLDQSGAIIDGHHRKQICDQLGIDCPTRTIDVDAATADRLRVTLNLARRHLSTAAQYDLIAWLAQQHEADAKAAAKGRAIEGNRRGGQGKSSSTVELDLHPNSKKATAEIARRINNDLAEMGETKTISQSTVARAQQWARTPQAQKNRAASGELSVTDVVSPNNKSWGSRGKGRTKARTSKRAPAREVTPQHVLDSQASIRAMYAETQYQSMLNAKPGQLNLPFLRRAEVIQEYLDDVYELDPIVTAESMPIERTPGFSPSRAEWWAKFADAAYKRWQRDAPSLPPPRPIRWVPLAERDLNRGDRQLLDWVRLQPEPVTSIEAAVGCRIGESTANHALARLRSAGMIEVAGLVDAGNGKPKRRAFRAAEC